MPIIRNLRINYARCGIILLALLLAVSLLLFISPKHSYGDFDVYYAASQRYLAKAPIYLSHNGIEEFKYSPLFALVFSPLTMLSRSSALYVWDILNIFFLYLIFYLFYRIKEMSFSRTRDFWIVFFLLALTGRFIYINIVLGQINIFLCFLMVLTMCLEMNKRYFWASVTLAFSLMIKFFPLLFLVYFILRKRFELVFLTLLMILFFLFVPSVYSGWDLNSRYLGDWLVLLKSSPSHLFYSVKNNSLLAFYSWFFIARHEHCAVTDFNLITKALVPAVYYCCAATCFFFFVLFFRDTVFAKDKNIRITCWDYSCLFVCGLLFNPLSYLNALVFLIVPCFFLLRFIFYSQKSFRSLSMIIVLLILSFVLNVIDHKIFFKDIHLYDDLVQLKPLMWNMILVYGALFIAKFFLKSIPCEKQALENLPD